MSYEGTQAELGNGMSFQFCATVDGEYQELGTLTEITKITLPHVSTGKVKATNSHSTIKEYVPDLADPGEAEVDFNFTAAAYIQALGFVQERVVQYFKVFVPAENGSSGFVVLNYKGYLSDLTGDVPAEGAVSSAKVKSQITNLITATDA